MAGDLTKGKNPPPVAVDDDEPDDWDKRIINTGCAAENTKLTDCWHDHKDWRKCSAEMAAFQLCWKKNQNDKRTYMTDMDKKQ